MSLFSRDLSDRPADLVELSNEYGNLRAAASERLGRFETYRNEQMQVRSPSVQFEQTSDYGHKTPRTAGKPKRHQIHLPLGKAMSVKHAYRIAGQLPDVVVDQRDSSKIESHRSDTKIGRAHV